MTGLAKKWFGGLWADNRGAASVETVLLLAVFGLPIMGLFLNVLLPMLAEYYQFMTCLITMPYP